MSFKKGQTITIKKRGAASELKQYGGTTFNVVRGGKNVTISTETATGTTTLKVNAFVLSASIKKS